MLNTGWRALSIEEINAVGDLLDQYGVSLWAILSEVEETRRIAHDLGLETQVQLTSRAGAQQSDAVIKASPAERTGTAGSEIVDDLSPPPLWHKGTLRSGQVLRHAGSVVLIGDINPGAELEAGGDIVVWGRLRGVALAGSPDNENAVIYALQMTPMLLGIAQVRSQMAGQMHHNLEPQVARLYQEQLIIEPWSDGKQR